MSELIFGGPPGPSGKGRPGVSRPAFTKPTARQPNRGLTADDPEFTCTVCHKVKSMDDNYRMRTKKGEKLSGWCTSCAQQKSRDAVARWRTKKRGPDYVLPEIKAELFPVVDGQRECSECRTVKAIIAFSKDKTVSSGYQNVCQSCRRSQNKARFDALPLDQQLEIKENRWRKWIWFRFCLTPDVYDEMLIAQDGVCAICKLEPSVRLCVDHDHRCCPGKHSCGACIRDLLCHLCNFTIGVIEQVGSTDPFADYLTKHARPQVVEVS